jgi:hypothetical protein
VSIIVIHVYLNENIIGVSNVDATTGRCLKPIPNTVFLTYLHTTYVSFIHIIPYIPPTIYMTTQVGVICHCHRIR